MVNATEKLKEIVCENCNGHGGGFFDTTDSSYEHTTENLRCEMCDGAGVVMVDPGELAS